MGLGGVAYFFAEEGFGDGGLDGDFTLLEVGLVGIDDGIGHFGVVGQISELHLTEQSDGIAVKNRSV